MDYIKIQETECDFIITKDKMFPVWLLKDGQIIKFNPNPNSELNKL